MAVTLLAVDGRPISSTLRRRPMVLAPPAAVGPPCPEIEMDLEVPHQSAPSQSFGGFRSHGADPARESSSRRHDHRCAASLLSLESDADIKGVGVGNPPQAICHFL